MKIKYVVRTSSLRILRFCKSECRGNVSAPGAKGTSTCGKTRGRTYIDENIDCGLMTSIHQVKSFALREGDLEQDIDIRFSISKPRG